MTGIARGRRAPRPRRVAVTSPQTRIALAGRRGSPPRLAPLTPEELRTAAAIRHAQLRRAVLALTAVALLLVGTPLLLAAVPALDELRLAGIPVSWLAVWVAPYPTLAGLAWWQLRHAEAIERAPR